MFTTIGFMLVIPILLFLVGIVVTAFTAPEPPPALPAVNAPRDGIAKSSTAQMITTAFELSAAVRTAAQARENRRATDAQIVALANAERLALAAARAAKAEASGIEAMMLRADRLTELYMRQITEEDAREEQLAKAEQKRLLARLRREKERYELKRETLEASHSLEATKQFKQIRFDIGLARARARQQDAEIDGKTAEAAVVKIAGELAKLSYHPSPEAGDWLDHHIALTESAIQDGEADGLDTSEKRAELAVLRRLRSAVGDGS